MKVDVTTVHGAKAGSVDLPDETFGITPNRSVLHQVVTAQLAAARAGTHSTKTRAAVKGGGAKPWRQKGTGRARHGSIRSPQWRWDIDEPSTKRAIAILDELGLRKSGEREPRTLLVLDRREVATWKSFRNLGARVRIVLPEELNAYDVLVNDWLVFSQATLDAFLNRGGSQ